MNHVTVINYLLVTMRALSLTCAAVEIKALVSFLYSYLGLAAACAGDPCALPGQFNALDLLQTCLCCMTAITVFSIRLIEQKK